MHDKIVLNRIHQNGYEKIIEAKDPKSGLHAIFVIHRSKPNTSIGGLRIHSYASIEEALNDVLRLAKSMSYKAALADIPYGGGKSIILLKPKQKKTPRLLSAFAQVLNQLNGEYTCGVDLGTTVDDVNIIRQTSPYVAGLNKDNIRVDLSSYTAWGCFRGIQATAQRLWGSSNLNNKTVAIQGLGNVGYKLMEHLFWAGANLIVSDTNQLIMSTVADQFGAATAKPEEILSYKCDILAPCATGNIINENTIPHLQCKAIAGAANNQLALSKNGDQLKALGILYAPDYVINAGGLITSAERLNQGKDFHARNARFKVNAIYDRLTTLYKISEEENMSTNMIADKLAEKKLEKYG